MTVDYLLAASAGRFPDKTAVMAAGASMSYARLNAEASRTARALLALGVQPGERVAAILPNSLEMVVVFFAVSRAGAVFVPINPGFTDHELAHILKDAGIRTAVCRSSHVDRLHGLTADTMLKDIVQVDDMAGLALYGSGFSDAVLRAPASARTHSILYTSGTTGKPKGAQMSHFSRIYNSLTCQIGYDVRAGTRMNCPAPLFHSGAMLLGMINVIAAGGTLLIPADAGPDATRHALVELGANYLLCVPTIIRRLVDDPAFCEAARDREFNVLHGAAQMPLVLAEQMGRAWPRCRPFHAYGATEAPQLTVLPPDEYYEHPGATGRALPGMLVGVCREDGSPTDPGEIGEITTVGPHVLDCYVNLPEATAQKLRGGMFWTGDLASIDERGIITILGRSNELIITGGLNVYAREIEDVLHAVPGVHQAAVFGVPDPEWGENVTAAIVPKSPGSVTEEQLLAACRQNLASYKKPKSIRFVDEMPLTPAGKVQKFRLLESLFPDAAQTVKRR